MEDAIEKRKEMNTQYGFSKNFGRGNMEKVLIINGVARSGKDTFADAIIACADNTGDTFAYKMSTVDNVKKISKYFGVGDEKTDKERRLWSDLKDAWSRYNDGPFKDVVSKISYLYDGVDSNSIYCVFVREPSEIAKFKVHYRESCMTILIRRPDTDIPDNHADENVNDYNYDCEIYNSTNESALIVNAVYMFDTMFIKSVDTTVN